MDPVSFAAGYIIGSIAFYFTIFKDIKIIAMEQAIYWHDQYNDFRDKVQKVVNSADKKKAKKKAKKDENSGKQP